MSKSRHEIYLNRKAMGKSPKRIYSIRSCTTGKVRWLNSNILLKDVELIVQQSGRQDTLRRLKNKEKITRTVHAFVRGEIINRGRNAPKQAIKLGLSNDEADHVSYDPERTAHWILTDGVMPKDVSQCPVIKTARYAHLHQDGILILQ